MIIHNFDKLPLESKKKIYLAIGMFDGVHRGHRALIEEVIRDAKAHEGLPAILTFWPHASRVLHPDKATQLIMLPEIKHDFLLEMGVDWIIQQEFTVAFSKIEAEAFVSLLKQNIPNLEAIYVGDNFRFGHKRLGDVELLKKEAAKENIRVISKPRVPHEGEVISSSRIRKELESGHIEQANTLLGYTYYSIERVVEGDKTGRKLGFPTLNMAWRPELKPKYGVYAVKVIPAEGQEAYNGVANYGIRPTLTEDKEPTLEVHLFSENVAMGPGDELKVEWHAFLRPEKKYPSQEALVEQIALDKAKAMEILG